jgi:hypothetical protein
MLTRTGPIDVGVFADLRTAQRVGIMESLRRSDARITVHRADGNWTLVAEFGIPPMLAGRSVLEASERAWARAEE